MREITCERCGGIAIRSPLCGSCAYALAVPTWERIKARIDSTVDDAALDRWMDLHPANPANLPNPYAEQERKEHERHEDQYAFEAFQQWRQEDR